MRSTTATGLRRWQGVTAAAAGAVVAVFAGGAMATLASVIESVVWGVAPGRTTFLVVAGSVIGTCGALLVVALVAPLLARVSLRDALGIRGARSSVCLATALGAVGLGPLADLFMTWLARVAPDFTLGVLPDLNEVGRVAPLVPLWLVLALLPGVCEEAFFRGLLQRTFGRGVSAILISGVSFAIFHMDPHQAIGVLPIGLFLAWAVAVTDSLWPAVVAHVANNTLAVVAIRVDALHVGYGSDEPMPLWTIPVGLALTAASAAWIIRSRRSSASPGGP